jgi:hypothetical protein
LNLKALVIATVGLVATAAIAGGFLVQLVVSVTLGPPLENSDLAGGFLVASLSAMVLFIALRAAQRVAAGEASEAPWLARLAPVLIVVGLAGGAWFAWLIQGDRRAHVERVAAELCAQPGYWRLEPLVCLSRARECVNASFRAEEPPAPALTALKDRVVADIKAGLAEDDVARKTDGEAHATEFPGMVLSRLNEPFSLGRKNRALLVCLDAR